MVLTIPPVRKKFTLAILASRAILHSMLKNETKLIREDLLALIVEHAENQAILTNAYFARIMMMTEDKLEAELARLESLAE
jgi:hypothetical protein